MPKSAARSFSITRESARCERARTAANACGRSGQPALRLPFLPGSDLTSLDRLPSRRFPRSFDAHQSTARCRCQEITLTIMLAACLDVDPFQIDSTMHCACNVHGIARLVEAPAFVAYRGAQCGRSYPSHGRRQRSDSHAAFRGQEFAARRTPRLVRGGVLSATQDASPSSGTRREAISAGVGVLGTTVRS